MSRAGSGSGPDEMIRIAITQAAFEAIASTLPVGSVTFEIEATVGDHFVWLAPNVVNRLRFLRGPGDTYSDVILRLVAAGDGIETQ
jgi:hypothetical protein